MIEDMKDEDILDKARMEGMNQGIWLAVQELAHDGRWTQAAEELISSCGLTEDESYTYNMDDNYWCATCGSHSHKKDSKTGYCWYCDTVNWVKEDRKDVGI